MDNEIIAACLLLGSLLGALLSYYMGERYLQTYVVLCYITANIITAKVGTFFGVDVTPGTFLFSAIFLSTDMLAERYGKKSALQAVYLSFFATVMFILMTQAILLYEPAIFANETSDALNLIFASSPRIFIASLLAYICWQYVDVYIYDYLHKRSGENLLWLRNNVSTFISSLGSTFFFFFLAFYNTPAPWLEMFAAAASIYWLVAILDTAFIYLSKVIKPLDIRNK